MSKYARTISLAALLAASAWALSGVSLAQAGPAEKARFEQYCSGCHGTDGKGDGPLANLLTEKPTDLTQLAKNNGG